MSSSGIIRRTIYALAAVMLCVLFSPRPAAADSTDVVTLMFSGAGTCVIGPCSGSLVTGTYSFDVGTDMIVGPWSFATPLGAFSSSGSYPFVGTEPSGMEGFTPGFNLLDFTSGDLGIQLAFDGSSGYSGSLITGPTVLSDPSAVGYLNISDTDPIRIFDLTSGTSTPVATPEPSALAMLGLGLLGLFVIRRKRSLRRLRLVQS
ncbi:MAG: PEP-CTERM sorting domain-containing protein [Candidatus Acidiferrales bacterium]